VPERKLGFFVKIKPPAPLPARRTYRPEGRTYAPEGKTKILTTPVRSAGPTGQAVILVAFRGLKFESDPREIGYAFHGAGTDIGGKNSFRSGTQ